jgi:hypothetical protein
VVVLFVIAVVGVVIIIVNVGVVVANSPSILGARRPRLCTVPFAAAQVGLMAHIT